MAELKKELENKFRIQIEILNDNDTDYDYMLPIWSWIEQKIKEAVTEYKSKLVEGRSSGEWQSILLVNALRLLNDKERNELALSIIERTTPNLLDEAKEEGFQAGCDFTCKQYGDGKTENQIKIEELNEVHGYIDFMDDTLIKYLDKRITRTKGEIK